eukprot:gene298-918_t
MSQQNAKVKWPLPHLEEFAYAAPIVLSANAKKLFLDSSEVVGSNYLVVPGLNVEPLAVEKLFRAARLEVPEDINAQYSAHVIDLKSGDILGLVTWTVHYHPNKGKRVVCIDRLISIGTDVAPGTHAEYGAGSLGERLLGVVMYFGFVLGCRFLTLKSLHAAEGFYAKKGFSHLDEWVQDPPNGQPFRRVVRGFCKVSDANCPLQPVRNLTTARTLLADRKLVAAVPSIVGELSYEIVPRLAEIDGSMLHYLHDAAYFSGKIYEYKKQSSVDKFMIPEGTADLWLDPEMWDTDPSNIWFCRSKKKDQPNPRPCFPKKCDDGLRRFWKDIPENFSADENLLIELCMAEVIAMNSASLRKLPQDHDYFKQFQEEAITNFEEIFDMKPKKSEEGKTRAYWSALIYSAKMVFVEAPRQQLSHDQYAGQLKVIMNKFNVEFLTGYDKKENRPNLSQFRNLVGQRTQGRTWAYAQWILAFDTVVTKIYKMVPRAVDNLECMRRIAQAVVNKSKVYSSLNWLIQNQASRNDDEGNNGPRVLHQSMLMIANGSTDYHAKKKLFCALLLEVSEQARGATLADEIESFGIDFNVVVDTLKQIQFLSLDDRKRKLDLTQEDQEAIDELPFGKYLKGEDCDALGEAGDGNDQQIGG